MLHDAPWHRISTELAGNKELLQCQTPAKVHLETQHSPTCVWYSSCCWQSIHSVVKQPGQDRMASVVRPLRCCTAHASSASSAGSTVRGGQQYVWRKQGVIATPVAATCTAHITPGHTSQYHTTPHHTTPHHCAAALPMPHQPRLQAAEVQLDQGGLFVWGNLFVRPMFWSEQGVFTTPFAATYHTKPNQARPVPLLTCSRIIQWVL
jgi:hypothetical protein